MKSEKSRSRRRKGADNETQSNRTALEETTANEKKETINSESENAASRKEPHQGIDISVVEKLISRMSNPEKRVHCEFFKVPAPIRRVRSICYEPQLICFGLYDPGKRTKECAVMEEVKHEVASAVLEVLLGSTDQDKKIIHSKVSGKAKKVKALWDHVCSQVLPAAEEKHTLRQYSGAPEDLKDSDARQLLVLDAIFLVSFMLFQHANPRNSSFGLPGFEKYRTLLHIFTKTGILCNVDSINSDIWLFENQVPLRLIRRVVREMYLHEEEEEDSGHNDMQKKENVEKACRCLVRETFQHVLRVLPGNYHLRSIQKTTGTDKSLRDINLRTPAHLLECLYRLTVDDNVDESSASNGRLTHDDSLRRVFFSTEETHERNVATWGRRMRENFLSGSRRSKTQEIDSLVDQLQLSNVAAEDAMPSIQELTVSDSKPKSKTVVARNSGRKRRRRERRSENVLTDVKTQLQPPTLQEFGANAQELPSERPEVPRHKNLRHRETLKAESTSESQVKLPRNGKKKKRASPQEPETDLTTDRGSFKSLPAQESSTGEASSEPSERKPMLCFQNGFLTRTSGVDTAIKIDSYSLPRATVLSEVGILVEGNPSPGCHCKIELRHSRRPLGSAVLLVSPLHVDGVAERLLRNLVAYEMVKGSEHKLITYLQCLDDLINNDMDVDLLKGGRQPVILNSSLDEKDVATLFNTLLEGCTVYNNLELEGIRKEVRSYYLQQWRRPWTEIQDRYCNGRKPWVAISLIAGLLILGLTAIQTVYTVIGNYKR